jgi:hypothetical protein
MCDNFDDFQDDFDNDYFMDDNSFDDSIDAEMDEPSADDTEPDEGFDDAESQALDDEFTAKDAFFLGSGMGFAYEEGLNERKRRKRKRFSDDSV